MANLFCRFEERIRLSGEWVEDVSTIRATIGPDQYAAVEPLAKAGWRIRRQGHAFRLYCPCPAEPHSTVRVDGTPRNPTMQARRITRDAARCPDHLDRQ